MIGDNLQFGIIDDSAVQAKVSFPRKASAPAKGAGFLFALTSRQAWTARAGSTRGNLSRQIAIGQRTGRDDATSVVSSRVACDRTLCESYVPDHNVGQSGGTAGRSTAPTLRTLAIDLTNPGSDYPLSTRSLPQTVMAHS